ncbi:hypothetical protein N9Y42_00080 [Mariniblastus sp.]|nr:hypothetical protein [Mariniblastus sp.]
MEKNQDNPYLSPDLQLDETAEQTSHRWLNWLAITASVYYIVSAVTLPFANKVRIGEIPIFGLIQLPKAFVKSVIHDVILQAIQRLGYSAGSASPDYGMTHPWAMGSMTAIPAILIITALLCLKSGRTRVLYLSAVIACAAIDAVVTLSFDASSSFKLYNASFF